MLPMLIVHDILDIDTVLMPTLLIRDTVIVDLSNVHIYFIQMCMYIFPSVRPSVSASFPDSNLSSF